MQIALIMTSVSTALHFSLTLISTVGGRRRVDRRDPFPFHCVVLYNALPTHCLATHCLRVRHCSHHNHCPAGELIPLLAGHSLQVSRGYFPLLSLSRHLKFVQTETSVPTDHTSLQISNTLPQFRRPKQQRSSGKRYHAPSSHPRASLK
jgi:hypothetical protein